MFLANLTDVQKPAFLNLARALIASDGVLSDSETSMMEQYQQEMLLPVSSDTSCQTEEQAEKVFETAPLTVRKQVMFELVALACADNEYADKERKLLEQIVRAFGLDAAFLSESQTYVRQLTSLYEQIGVFVAE